MFQFFLLILSAIIVGCLSVTWNMSVSPRVSVSRGDDAVLGCSFTHPRQQDYSGTITVQWLAREANNQPFFQCSVRNHSMAELSDCSGPGLRFSVVGDPRQGALSLRIRRVQLTDEGVYYCRVELDEKPSSFQKKTHLDVTAKPQILRLSVLEDSATRRLQCEVEGHPRPTITWLSASTPVSGDQVQTSESGPYRLISTVLYLKDDQVFTCRAESELGGAERRYPDSNSVLIALSVCGLILLLLLLTGCIVYRLKHKDGADVSPVYENAEVVGNDGLRGSEAPADGDVEPQLCYSVVTLHSSTSSQHASFRRSTQLYEDTETFYSPVNIQR